MSSSSVAAPPHGFHFNWNRRHARLLSAVLGYRNGIISGVRIRLPYVFQAVIYAIIFQQGGFRQKISFVVKQMIQHGKNLGMFVGIYKAICYVLRRPPFNITGGLESWIAGFIGGFTAFGSSQGISGSVNNQIVLYLFARGLHGLMVSAAAKNEHLVPSALDVRTPLGFRVLAGFSLALILYLTEYQPNSLRSSFMSTMNFLYYDSETPQQPLLPPPRFLPFALLVTLSLLSPVFPALSLDNFYRKFLS
ncbi:Transmembrane protein [Balamuthia mandrillaris]